MSKWTIMSSWVSRVRNLLLPNVSWLGKPHRSGLLPHHHAGKVICFTPMPLQLISPNFWIKTQLTVIPCDAKRE